MARNAVKSGRVYLAADQGRIVRRHSIDNTKGEGYYGNESHDRHATLKIVLLAAIRDNFSDKLFFTREDLLQLACMQGVATITRYHEVCVMVQELIHDNRIENISRTELRLKTSRRKPDVSSLLELHHSTIIDLIQYFAGVFTVMDIVQLIAISNLTVNAKRALVRRIIHKLEAVGKVAAVSPYQWEFTKPSE